MRKRAGSAETGREPESTQTGRRDRAGSGGCHNGASRMSDATTNLTTRKVLFVSGRGRQPTELLELFGSAANVTTVRSFDDALTAMRREVFDLVVSDQGDFLALERAAASQQATAILESIGQGICIVDMNGRALYANPAMQAFPADLTQQVCQQCRRAFATRDNEHDATRAGPHRVRRFSMQAGRDQHFEVTATPILDSNQQLQQIVAVVWDVTSARRLQARIDAIDMAGRELVQLGSEATAALSIEDRLRLLEEQILRYTNDLLHFDNFAVLLIDKKTNKLEIVVEHGMSERTQRLELYVSPEGNGISGYVAATGRSYICHDIRNDPRYIEGLASAQSSLTVPMRLHDKIIGVFDIESEQPNAFNEEDRQFTEILARYIALALNTLDVLVTERHRTTGRLADDVSSEIAGPLNDILTEAVTLMEEYIGHDDLRRRLSSISDNVSEIKRTIREVASPKGGLLGRRIQTPTADPVLSGKRILVADDEEIIRETIAGVLTRHGCEVETAADGLAAIAMIEGRRYDVVIADIKMPHKTGYEIFASVTTHSPSTPVVLMTAFGYDPSHSIVRARREGLAAVLFKPFKVEQLLTELRTAVAGPPGDV